MTEVEWLTCENPRTLAEYLFDYGSPRKLRLWVCACGREIIPFFKNPLIVKVLSLFESVAEGERLREEHQRPLSELQWAAEDDRSAGFHQAVAGIAHSQWIEMAKGHEGHFALGMLHPASAEAYGTSPTAQPEGSDRPTDPTWRSTFTAAQKKQSTLVRDIFGNPFRPVSFGPSWRTSTVLAVDTGIYEDRAFDRMQILADALQDAGCNNDVILSHLRGDGPHAKGCWALDLLLGKS